MSIPKMIIGHTYMVPDGSGDEVEGVLEDAVVLESEGRIYGTYRLTDGRRINCSNPMTPEEKRDYKQDPDNFFGVYKPIAKQVKNFEDAYNFLWATYSKSTKEKLLEFMANAPNIEELRKHSQRELAKIYCTNIARQMTADLKGKLN
jgi:hypothetical protein